MQVLHSRLDDALINSDSSQELDRQKDVNDIFITYSF